jgi:hypothetical protein
MPSDSLFTFQSLGTIGGSSLLCFLFVAYTKGLIDSFAPWVPTNVYSLFIGSSILFVVQLNTDPNSLYMWQTYFLSVANGILVSATASHTNELSTRFPKLIKTPKDVVPDEQKVKNVTIATNEQPVAPEKTGT